MRIENKLTSAQCLEIGERIRDYFDNYAQDDPFGWDWPTMRTIFPVKCRVFERLRIRFKTISKGEERKVS